VNADVRIESDGGIAPGSTKVFIDGQRLTGVSNVAWKHNVDGLPVAEITVLCVPIETTSHQVRWHGLEAVPDAALHQELARRRQAHTIERETSE
jgi:hypothetical protein